MALVNFTKLVVMGMCGLMAPATIQSKPYFMNADCQQVIDSITIMVAQELAKHHTMVWVEGWNDLSLNFCIYRPLTAVEAESLMTVCAQTLISAQNSNPSSIACNGGRPFILSDITVELHISSPEGLTYFEPFVSSASFEDGTYVVSYDNPQFRHVASNRFCGSLAGYDGERVAGHAERSFSKKALDNIVSKTKRSGVVLRGIGWSEHQLSLGFNVYRPMTVNEARSFILRVMQVSLTEISHDVRGNGPFSSCSPTVEHMFIGIDSYRKKSKDLFPYFTKAPYVTSIVVRNGEVTYTFKDEHFKDHQIKEPYSTTIRLAKEPIHNDAVKEFAQALSREQQGH